MNWYDKILFFEQLKIAGFNTRVDNQWDHVWENLKRKLGRKPENWEVQQELLRIENMQPEQELALV